MSYSPPRLENIGFVRLTKSHVFRQAFETASWYRDIEVPAGEYPIHLSLNPEGLPQFVVAKLPGVCTASHFVNRVLWASSSETDQDVGRSFDYGLQIHAYVVAGMVAEGMEFQRGSGITFSLDPAKVASRPHSYPSRDLDGNPVTRTGFNMACVRPIGELLREQREVNRQPLTEEHQLIHQAHLGSAGTHDEHFVRLHAVESGFKVLVTTRSDVESAGVVSVAEASGIEDAREKVIKAMGWRLTVMNRSYHEGQLDAAIERWTLENSRPLAL